MGRGDHPDGRVERWLPVVGYEGSYEVSDQGQVRSLDRVAGTAEHPRRWKGRVLQPAPVGKCGHLMVALRRDGKSKSWLVHALVLTAFVGPRPVGMECCHGLGGTQDNSLQNLRWDTSSENNFDIVRQGRHRNASKTRCKYGHQLKGPNLYQAGHRNERVCKACCTARTLINRGVPMTFQQISDESYRCSMLGLRARWPSPVIL